MDRGGKRTSGDRNRVRGKLREGVSVQRNWKEERSIDEPTYRQTDRQTDRQIDRQTDRQTDSQINITQILFFVIRICFKDFYFFFVSVVVN